MGKGLSGIVRKHVAHFFASFGYSLAGLRFSLAETAVRQELALGAVVVPVAVFLDIPFAVSLMLVCLWVLVLVVELLNTALEAVVDLASPERHPLAKKAKDCASAAVFLVIALNAVAWVCVLARRFCF